ncbi:MAG: TetR/AcrR family transcriptional regulator [Actinomycetota bacterium]|nr:TetR/AcrR family transcriptional regulator [Actinomycetota bacterium]
MLKPVAQTAPEGDTKGRIVQAALETLKVAGFAGTSARAIARRGGFNQALIFYHFGSLNALLLEALDDTSRRRMHAYTELVERSRSVEELVSAAVRIYREDLDSGHITVLSEVIAGSLAHPELGPEVVARIEPWIAFAQQAIAKVTQGSPLAQVVPSREMAFALVAFYLGVEMLNHLDGNRERAEALFKVASDFAPVVGSLLQVQA